MSSSSPKIMWFQKHPVVATVLWLLGADPSKDANTSPRTSAVDPNTDKDNTLTWKDDHGGDIAEYMEVISKKPPSECSSSSSTNSSSNKSLGLKVSDSQSGGVLLENSSSRSLQFNSTTPSTPCASQQQPVAKSSESPQWDFFVAITPPTNDKHPRSKDTTTDR